MDERNGEQLRALHPEDIPAAFRLSAAAGWNQTEDDWRTLLELAPEGCLATEVDGRLASTTTLLCYGRRLAWIGMVLTSSEYRRRGLARKLLERVVAQADQLGIETIKLDATDQGQPLYEQFGFHREREIERWSRPGGEVDLFPIAQTFGEPVWHDCDLPMFGADRSQLLDRLARRNPPIVYSQSYLFARPGRMTAYLGPCIGENLETARRLIEQRLQNTDCAWSWDLFPGNRDAAALARDLGFTPQRRLVRMARGKELSEKDNAIYAIAGFELG